MRDIYSFNSRQDSACILVPISLFIPSLPMRKLVFFYYFLDIVVLDLDEKIHECSSVKTAIDADCTSLHHHYPFQHLVCGVNLYRMQCKKDEALAKEQSWEVCSVKIYQTTPVVWYFQNQGTFPAILVCVVFNNIQEVFWFPHKKLLKSMFFLDWLYAFSIWSNDFCSKKTWSLRSLKRLRFQNQSWVCGSNQLLQLSRRQNFCWILGCCM